MLSSSTLEMVCKLPIEDTDTEIVMKTSWNERNFCAVLYDGVHAWAGNLNEEQADCFSQQLDLTMEEYMTECISALTTNGGSKGFVYRIENDKFQWKKSGLEMKIMFGYIYLNSVPVIESLENVVHLAINKTCSLANEICKLQQEKTILQQDNIDILKKLDECISLKNKMEEELYSQFLVILNTKKRKIVELQKQIGCKKLEDVSDEEKEEFNRENYYERETDVDSDSDDSDKIDQPAEFVTKSSDKETPSTSSKPDNLLPKIISALPPRRTKKIRNESTQPVAEMANNSSHKKGKMKELVNKTSDDSSTSINHINKRHLKASVDMYRSLQSEKLPSFEIVPCESKTSEIQEKHLPSASMKSPVKDTTVKGNWKRLLDMDSSSSLQSEKLLSETGPTESKISKTSNTQNQLPSSSIKSPVKETALKSRSTQHSEKGSIKLEENCTHAKSSKNLEDFLFGLIA